MPAKYSHSDFQNIIYFIEVDIVKWCILLYFVYKKHYSNLFHLYIKDSSAFYNSVGKKLQSFHLFITLYYTVPSAIQYLLPFCFLLFASFVLCPHLLALYSRHSKCTLDQQTWKNSKGVTSKLEWHHIRWWGIVRQEIVFGLPYCIINKKNFI